MVRRQGDDQVSAQGAAGQDNVEQMVRDVAREVGVDENTRSIQGDPQKLAGQVKDAIQKRT
jgi:hypothetical protein